jgi:hypothetical protein
MERLGATCSGKLFWIWGLYAGGMLVLSELADAAGLPASLSWVMALALGAAVLGATERL